MLANRCDTGFFGDRIRLVDVMGYLSSVTMSLAVTFPGGISVYTYCTYLE